MDKRPLEERGESLEEQFFRRQNAELLEKMRTTRERETARETMAGASGINDPEILDRLIEEGVSPATLAALSLAPLAAVAWADGKLETKERSAALNEAESAGVSAGTPAHELLEAWLSERPPASLMDTWSSYTAALSGTLPEDERKALRDTVVSRALAVANAAGGFAGMGAKLSAAEEAVFKRMEAAFSG